MCSKRDEMNVNSFSFQLREVKKVRKDKLHKYNFNEFREEKNKTRQIELRKKIKAWNRISSVSEIVLSRTRGLRDDSERYSFNVANGN